MAKQGIVPVHVEDRIVYKASPTIARFHQSRSEIRGIRGVVGSGKTVGCVVEMKFKSESQAPWHGIRKTKWVVIRETFPQLRDTTIPTFLKWIPVEHPWFARQGSRISHSPPYVAELRYNMEDGTRVEADFIFLAMREDADVEKLKSLEYTAAYINEAGAVKRVHFSKACERTSRYPPSDEGGCSWSGVIMDTNPPDDESWWYDLEVKNPIPNAEFFVQPPAILPVPKKDRHDVQLYVPNMGQGQYPPAENVENLTKGYDYWMDQVHTKTPWEIRVFLMGEFGTSLSGTPVYAQFHECHFTAGALEVYRQLPLLIGIDFGRTPAAVFCQLSPRGQLRVIDELTTGFEHSTVKERMGIRTFGRTVLLPHINTHYPGMPIVAIGDPAGGFHSQISDEETCLLELSKMGIPCQAARTNSLDARLGAVEGFMMNMLDGEAGLIVSALKAPTILKGFQGGYRFLKKHTSADADNLKNEPDKDSRFSHPHDALQYVAMYAEYGVSKDFGSASNCVMRARPVKRRRSKAW